MGKVITFAELPYREAGPGVTRAPITGAEMKEMAAEVIRLAPGAQLTESVPAGADRYLFTLTGAATVAGGGASRTLVEESFATIQEGAEFTLGNPGRSEATLISVITPPPGSPAGGGGGGGGGRAPPPRRPHREEAPHLFRWHRRRPLRTGPRHDRGVRA
jgi:mannose-6-phosphate isomerase-like protein (cupin superfamily)